MLFLRWLTMVLLVRWLTMVLIRMKMLLVRWLLLISAVWWLPWRCWWGGRYWKWGWGELLWWYWLSITIVVRWAALKGWCFCCGEMDFSWKKWNFSKFARKTNSSRRQKRKKKWERRTKGEEKTKERWKAKVRDKFRWTKNSIEIQTKLREKDE